VTVELLSEPSSETRALIAAVVHALADAIVPEVAAQIVEQVRVMLARPTSAIGPQVIDAAMLAERLGVSRWFIYEHADELGGVRLGDGPRARLRFDLDQALEAWNARSTSERSQPAKTPVAPGSAPTPRRTRTGRRAAGLPEPGSVLAIRGPASERRAA
jgi:hypothetical protein